MTRGKHKQIPTTDAGGSSKDKLCIVSTFLRVWSHCFLTTFSPFLFRHIFIFKNSLKSFNLHISTFLLDCILPSCLFPLFSHSKSFPFLICWISFKEPRAFYKIRRVFSLVWVQRFSEILLTVEEGFWNVMLWGFQKAASLWYLWAYQKMRLKTFCT